MATPVVNVRGSSDDVERGKIKKRLELNLMRGKWNEVVSICKTHADEEVHGHKMRQSEDTALHMAVYQGKKQIVKELVGLMSTKTLAEANGRGDTPLHLAARIGTASMCLSMAKQNPDLIHCRNNDNNTPIFLAALQGNMQAYYVLYHVCSFKDKGMDLIYQIGRGNRGRTILHCAIDGEYFDLAYDIINRLPDFHYMVDENGRTPLHLLATKHSVFRSSSRLSLTQRIYYPIVPAEEPHVKRYPTLEAELWLHSSSENSQPSDVENPPLHDPSTTNDQLTKKSYFFRSLAWEKKVLQDLGHLNTRLFPKDTVKMKKKHVWSVEIMRVLMKLATLHDYTATGGKPASSDAEGFLRKYTNTEAKDDNDSSITICVKKDGKVSCEKQSRNKKDLKDDKESVVRICIETKGEEGSSEKHSQNDKNLPVWAYSAGTPLLIAAMNGITEMVDEILENFPMAIYDVNKEGRNVMLLAAEHRQPQVYDYMLRNCDEDSKRDIFGLLDKKGNSALHLAAALQTYRPWLAPNAVLQMQWEIKWYEFIKKNVPRHLAVSQNDDSKTPEEIFMRDHQNLVKSDAEWLIKTSESCSIVAALVATVAFTTSTTVPGGVRENGDPVLQRRGPFELFAVSSLIALCFSLTAVITFLSIITSRYHPTDFGKSLPWRLLAGLTMLFISIASMLVCFCSGHFFIAKDVMTSARIAEYTVVILPVTIFAIVQFPLYYKLLLATFKRVPSSGFILSG